MQQQDYGMSRAQGALQQKPPAMAPPPTDSDFKEFVLYVTPGDSGCARALEALSTNREMKLDTLIQDVTALPARPVWLDVVPLLAVKTERKAYKAAACIDFIAGYKRRGAPPRSNKRGAAAQRLDKAWSSEDF